MNTVVEYVFVFALCATIRQFEFDSQNVSYSTVVYFSTLF